jgi:hypothetical protein
MAGVSLNVDSIAYHPDFQLIEALLPACLESLHPFSVRGGVRHIHDQSSKAVMKYHAFVPPISLGGILVITRRVKLINDLIDGFTIRSSETSWPSLHRELGKAGMIRFLQQYETGSGNYARERHSWVDQTSLDDIRAAAIGKQTKKT